MCCLFYLKEASNSSLNQLKMLWTPDYAWKKNTLLYCETEILKNNMINIFGH